MYSNSHSFVKASKNNIWSDLYFRKRKTSGLEASESYRGLMDHQWHGGEG